MAAPDDRVAVADSIAAWAGARPVQDDELDALFFPLSGFPVVVLAVSGGADSMALMLLARRWAKLRSDAPRIIVASVDHGLREASRVEAEWVAGEARALGFAADVLTWSGVKPATGIQDAARAERYRLLAGFARETTGGPAAIVTAHTEDDQAETLLMRLARGSGLDGLAAMPVARRVDDRTPAVMLVRPLLTMSGARMRATLAAAKLAWIEDPSNDADRFERVRVRKARAELAALGLDNDKIGLSARRLSRAREALDAATAMLGAAAQLDLHAGAYASFDADAWRSAAEELRLRLVGRLISGFGGRTEPLRLAQLEALVARMVTDGFEGATLAGAAISLRKTSFHVMREPGRSPLPELVLEPGASAVWDHRFRVSSARGAAWPVEVRALGATSYAQLRRQLDEQLNLPARAAATLPAFWRKGELLYVPGLAGGAPVRSSWDASSRLYSAEFLG